MTTEVRKANPGEVPGEKLAQGATADIHIWDDDHIIKLFNAHYGLETARYEARVARLVEQAGIEAPAVGDIIQIGERYGLIYERAHGEQLARRLEAQPFRLWQYARVMACLHASIHQQHDDSLPSQRERLERAIQQAAMLTPTLRDQLLERLRRLPDDNVICHGDLHPENILQEGDQFVVIDWIDCTRGHAMADVARSCVLMMEEDQDWGLVDKLMHYGPRRWFRDAYLREYFKLRQGTRQQVKSWLPVVAAARLNEKAAENKNLLSIVVAGLKD